ncbi:MAG: CBS domain-containing protein [Chloroflexi bacterium]|nr:CBS domain-containing protein [Chloroflexota bacterium]
MPFFSKLQGRTVRDSQGHPIGKLKDILVSTGEPFPVITALAVADRGRSVLVPWSQVASLDNESPLLRVSEDQLQTYQPGPHEISLGSRVLDRQIIDINGRRVVRVNDLSLARVNGNYRLVGADVSTRALLRRLGLEVPVEKLLSAFHYELPSKYISWDTVDPVESGPTGIRLRVQHEALSRMHPADIADIVEQLGQSARSDIFESLDDETAADALMEVDPDRQISVIDQMDSERAADIIELMPPDEAADLLAEMAPDRAEELLKLMEKEEARDVRELLAYPEDSAGGIMTTEYVGLSPSLTADQAIQRLRELSPEAEIIYYVYVVNEEEHLLGVISLRDLIVAPPDKPLSEFMIREVITVDPYLDQEEVAQVFAKYNLLAVPVVDEERRILGIITVDDAIDMVIPTPWKKRLPKIFA